MNKTMASPELHDLIAKLRSRPRPDDPTIEQLRLGFEALSRQFPPPPEGRFEQVSAAGVPAEWVTLPDSPDYLDVPPIIDVDGEIAKPGVGMTGNCAQRLRPNKDDGRRSAGHHPRVRRWSSRYMTQWQ